MIFKKIVFLMLFFAVHCQEDELKKAFRMAIDKNDMIQALTIICQVNSISPKNKAIIDLFTSMFENKWDMTILDLAKSYVQNGLSQKIQVLEKKVDDVLQLIPVLDAIYK